MILPTKEFKVYKYPELGTKAKEKVKQEYLEHIDPYDFTYNVIEDLKNIGLKNLRSYYSLSYCQSDGLCLVGHIDFDEISPELKKIFYKDFLLSDHKILKNLKEHSRIEFNHIGQYYHRYSVDINIYLDRNLSTKKSKNHKKTANKLIKNITDWYMHLCSEYEMWGYKFFYDVTDKNVEEFYDAMEYKFLEDGTIFN